MIKHTGYSVRAFMILVMVCSVTCPALAKRISRSEAAVFAAGYIEVPASTREEMASRTEQFMPYYIFNDATPGHGFVVVAGNDDIYPVLGYSGSGNLSEDNMPPSLKEWLSHAANLTSVAPEPASAGTPVVDALVKTNWYQLEPYNGKLVNDKVLTGCVATAMAQVINYHKWPSQGHGTGKYDSFAKLSKGKSSVGIIEFDLSKSTYDYDNMLSTYTDGNWTQAQADAVATLMRDCGYAACMQYTTSVSESYDVDMAIGMSTHFGYDVKIYPHFSDYSDTEKWLEIMKKEFDNGYPVIFTGQSSMFGGDGHCFILDGYDSNNFVHVNWGWNGDADGYYNVCQLYPRHNNANLDYSYMQYFITVHPRKDGTYSAYNPTLVMLWDINNQSIDNSGLTVAASGQPVTAGAPAKVCVDGLCFISCRAYSGKFMLRLFDSNGNEVKDLATVEIDHPALSEDHSNQLISEVSEINIPADVFAGIPDGTYTVLPMSKYQDMEEQKILVYGYKQSLKAEIQKGVARIYNIERPEAKLVYTRPLALEPEIPLFSKVEATVDIANNGDFIEGGNFKVEASTADGTSSIILFEKAVSLYEGMTTSVPVSLPILNKYKNEATFKFEAGKTYSFKYWLESADGTKIDISGESSLPDVTITYSEAMVPKVVLTSVEVLDPDGNTCDISNLRLDNDKDCQVVYSYRTEGLGAWPEELHLEYGMPFYAWQHRDDIPEQTVGVDILLSLYFLKPGENTFEFQYEDFMTGKFVYAEPANLSRLVFKIDEPSGINNVKTDGKVSEVARYDVSGRRLSKPGEGINIVVYSNGMVRKEHVVLP